MRLVAAIVLLLASPAHGGEVDQLKRYLWPHTKTTPTITHVEPDPPVEHPPPALHAPVEHVPLPQAAPRSVEKHPKPKPRERRSQADDSGPDLPYSCALVRFYARGKTVAQLEQMGRDNGVSLSAKQRRQAAACFSGKG